MRPSLSCIALLAIAFGLCAETHLGGTLNKSTLDTDGNPYIVEEDVIIPADQHVVVKAGCVFLFKPFTGMQVHGRITAEGSMDKPIVFTSINDQEYNPRSTQPGNPFDWNGVLVTPESQNAAFKNFVLRFSVYGIKAQTPNITIQNGKFRQNGQFHFTINDKIQYVQDDFYYSYGVNDQQPSGEKPKEKPRLVKKSPKGGRESRGKIAFRWGCFGVGAGGVVVGTTLLFVAANTHGEWDDIAADWEKARSSSQYTPDQESSFRAKFSDAESRYNGQMAVGIILESLGVLGAAGFGISFAF